MAGVNVRRLAAIDMYGTQGPMRRRRIVLVEFVAGVVVAAAFGIWLVAYTSGLGGRMLGTWMIGAGLNYALLAAYAIALSRPGALDGEMSGVDTGRELRRYTVLQFWIFVPFRSPSSPCAPHLAAVRKARRARLSARGRAPSTASDLGCRARQRRIASLSLIYLLPPRPLRRPCTRRAVDP